MITVFRSNGEARTLPAEADSAAVEAGYGETVKGLNDWEGEITGKPAPGSKFTQLQIGMPMKQVTDIIGEPTDQGVYVFITDVSARFTTDGCGEWEQFE